MPERRIPWRGYAMVAAAASLFAVNGTVSKVILAAGVPSDRLTEIRVTGAFVGLAVVLAALRPRVLRLDRREVPFLLFFGVFGVALVQWLYFVAIDRLAIGIALLIQYLAPLIVALWARFAQRQPVRRRIWLALALALVGLALIVEVWGGGSLDGVGVAASFAAAVSFALYILAAERAVGARDPLSVTCYGFLFAAAFWAVVTPWWGFPVDVVGGETSLLGNLADIRVPVWLLIGYMVVLGTIAPFTLLIAGLRHVAATRAGITAMLEPVLATIVAYAWLAEELRPVQLAGAGIVLCGIVLAQTARPAE